MNGLDASAQPRGTRRVELLPGLVLPGGVSGFARGDAVFAQQARATLVYKVVSGAVRTTRLLSDGRRHVRAFHLPGEVFGFEAAEHHLCGAETLTDSRIASVRRTALEAAAAREAGAATGLWRLAAQAVARVEAHALLLARGTASERVTAFMLDLAEREGGGPGVSLPMSRTDIADHLGLTIETVSRILSRMRRDRLIELPSARTVVFGDRFAGAPRARGSRLLRAGAVGSSTEQHGHGALLQQMLGDASEHPFAGARVAVGA